MYLLLGQTFSRKSKCGITVWLHDTKDIFKRVHEKFFSQRVANFSFDIATFWVIWEQDVYCD